MAPHTIIIHNKQEWHFSRPSEVAFSFSPNEVHKVITQADIWAHQGKYVIGWVCYESALAFDHAFPKKQNIPELPLVWFGAFHEPIIIPLSFSAKQPAGHQARHDWQPMIKRQEYNERFQIIHENICKGNVYQVNLTFPLTSKIEGDLQSLFYHLCFAQGDGYFVYIQTEDFSVLSISPELFFHYKDGSITLKPMKGTRPRGRWNIEDTKNLHELKNDPKDRAENLMIVDLLRNDVGKIAIIGSVEVPELFSCEPYRTVWQMTSTIRAKTETRWMHVLSALFPSGSVTGAPKIYAMKLINELEKYPRGIYCGAVGWITPKNEATFNVAIRTLIHNKKTNTAYYYVGSGIVWDSEADKEWEECISKSAILNNFPSYFSLIETLRVENKEIFLLTHHLQRLENSAKRFQFPLSMFNLKTELTNYIHSTNEPLYRLRITVTPDGKFSFEKSPYIETKKIKVGFAKKPIHTKNLFLYHKTTYRCMYEEAKKERPDCDDVLLWNEEGYLTESTIANLVVCIGGRLFTPPIHCGLLPGTFRQYLLDHAIIEERCIKREELQSANAIYLINSVRKWIDIDWNG
ncbi:MAG: aminodeoxychorismate synthase component I [Candidatus Hydrogenedens sp.]|nr:aminodeoxychorismate synthase component I [Candidatus Hydrogenedens sp.]